MEKANPKSPVIVVAGVGLLVLVVGIATIRAGSGVAQNDPKGIIGTVLNSNGQQPEAGVWVIAETTSLPTPYRKIVVTNDDGKFVVPDLPKGDYQVWVRGYGLKDSNPVKGTLGGMLDLQVSTAATPQEAAKVYPANYWLSLYQPPLKEDLPKEYTSQEQWVGTFKRGCQTCHQIGSEPVRQHTTPEEFDAMWKLAPSMSSTADRLGREALAKSLADWGKRIAAGEVPPAPPRPSGIERNIVVTQWQWGQWNSYMHDEVSTDKRNPSLYSYGKVYGSDYGQDFLWALDPVANRVSSYKVPTTNIKTVQPDWTVLNNSAHPHNPMMDDKGNVWITAQVRDNTKQPKWAADVVATKTGDEQAIAEKLMAENRIGHNLERFDTKTEKFVMVDTAYSTHHLEFDAQGRLWTTTDRLGMGMFDPSKFDPSNPLETAERAQKDWIAIDLKTGMPTDGGGYGIAVDPVDQTVWRAHPSNLAGNGDKVSKFDPSTETFKDYALPPPARNPHGIDMTSDGIVWISADTGHLVRLDPKTDEFKKFVSPGPSLKGTILGGGTADTHYQLWVDRFNTLGMGKDMVIVDGTNSDALLAFSPATEKWTVMRIPYPLGFFQRGLDGRIDDPNGGWKGRGLWTDYGGDPIRFTEKTHMGNLNHIQLRPDPLAH